jgi:hypothetical protein
MKNAGHAKLDADSIDLAALRLQANNRIKKHATEMTITPATSPISVVNEDATSIRPASSRRYPNQPNLPAVPVSGSACARPSETSGIRTLPTG